MTFTALFVLILLSLVVLVAAGTVTIRVSKSISGMVSMSETVSLVDSSGVEAMPTISAAQPSTLTTRTSNTAGTLTMTNSNHGITTGQRVDLYWSGGQCFGAVVGTVAGTSVPIASVSGGSVLPSTSTPISVGIPISTPFAFTGNNLSGLTLYAPKRGYFVFNSGSDLANVYLAAGGTYQWYPNNGITNPLAGVTPTIIYMSHGDETGPVTTMLAAAVYH